MTRPPFGYDDEEWYEIDYSSFDFWVSVVPEHLVRPRPGRDEFQLNEELGAAEQVAYWKRRKSSTFADWAQENPELLRCYKEGDKLTGKGSQLVNRANRSFDEAYENWREVHNAPAFSRVRYAQVSKGPKTREPAPF